jgi:ribosomal protein L32E
MINPHNVIFNDKERNESSNLKNPWRKLKCIFLSERRQYKKLYIIPTTVYDILEKTKIVKISGIASLRGRRKGWERKKEEVDGIF